MMSLSISRVLGPAFLLLGILATGCATEAEAQVSDVELEGGGDALGSEAQVVAAFKKAVRGLKSNGGEGDPMQLKVMLLPGAPNDSMSFPKVATRVGAAIPELREGTDGAPQVYGFQCGVTMAAYWAENTAEPKPSDYKGDAAGLRKARSDAAKFRALKLLSDANLKSVVNLTVGVDMDGSIENGAVAQVLAGKLPSGKLLVIYGIDIWT